MIFGSDVLNKKLKFTPIVCYLECIMARESIMEAFWGYGCCTM